MRRLEMIVSRLAWFVPTLAGLVVIVFLISNVIPTDPAKGLDFKKVKGDVYEWLGFEAYQLIMGFLQDVAADGTLELDLFAYDLNEPDVVALLEKIGPRLRAVIDDSGSHKPADSAESQAAARLAQ